MQTIYVSPIVDRSTEQIITSFLTTVKQGKGESASHRTKLIPATHWIDNNIHQNWLFKWICLGMLYTTGHEIFASQTSISPWI